VIAPGHADALRRLRQIALRSVARESTNFYDGRISIGHPSGATGARMALVATQHIEDTGGRRAVVSTRVGARRGTAMLFDLV
jgi:acetyl-CoA C-acetyltransferase